MHWSLPIVAVLLVIGVSEYEHSSVNKIFLSESRLRDDGVVFATTKENGFGF